MKISLPYLTYQSNKPMYRRRIPAVVRAAFGGQQEVFADLTLQCTSLDNPADIRKAATLKRLVAMVDAEFESVLARARAGAQVGRFDRAVCERVLAKAFAPALVPTPCEMTVGYDLGEPVANRTLREEDIDVLAERYKCFQLVADDDIRFGEAGASEPPMTREEHREYKELIAETVAQLREAQARGDSSIVRETVVEVLSAEGFSTIIADNLFQRLERRFLAVDVEAAQVQLQRANGESIVTPDIPEFDDESLTLSTMLENWRLVRLPSSKTVVEAHAAVRLFGTWCTESYQRILPVNRLVIEDVAAFRDWLTVHVPKRNQKTGAALHPASVRKYLGLLTAIVNSFMADRTVDFKNVFGEVKRPHQARGQGRPRTAFRSEQLVHLFQHPRYVALSCSVDAFERTEYWFMLIGLFTGARLEEIGQLLVRDIVSFGDNTFFYFCDEAPGQELKTSAAEADARSGAHHVPVHAELVRLGFLGYVAAQRARVGLSGQLFDALKLDSHGARTGYLSKRLNHILDECGLDDSRLAFHSFRHTFKHFARMCGIAKAVVDQLVAHKSSEVGDGYGGDYYPVEPLLDGMRRYQLPFMDFSHLHPKAFVTGAA